MAPKTPPHYIKQLVSDVYLNSAVECFLNNHPRNSNYFILDPCFGPAFQNDHEIALITEEITDPDVPVWRNKPTKIAS